MKHTGPSITCRAGQFSRHISLLRPNPAYRDRHPLPDTSYAACTHWFRQRLNPFSPGLVHRFPAAHWGVLSGQGTFSQNHNFRLYTLPFKRLGSVKKSVVCSQRLHLFDYEHSNNFKNNYFSVNKYIYIFFYKFNLFQ